MAEIPQILQKLEKGKLLCAKNFPDFVATWNYLVDFVNNLSGDYAKAPRDASDSGDDPPESEFDGSTDAHGILLDRSNPAFPVLRYIGKPSQGGGAEGVEMDVITSVSVGTNNYGDIVLTYKTRKVRVISAEEKSAEKTSSALSKEVTVVTGSSYSTSTHKFVNSTRKIRVFARADADTQTEVFEATPHSHEPTT